MRAGIDLDGTIYGKSLTDGFGKPFMFLTDGNPLPTSSELEAGTGATNNGCLPLSKTWKCIKRGLSEKNGYWVTIQGVKHWNFCDSPLYCPVKWFSGAGPISHKRATEIVNACVLSFFKKYLNSEDDGLLDGSSHRFPEAEIEQLLPN